MKTRTITTKEYLMIVIIFVLTITAHNVKADTVIQLHTFSYHKDREAKFNEENYGLAVRHYNNDRTYDYSIVGAYKNSEYNTSTYAGVGWEWKKGNIILDLSIGAVTGYIDAEIQPYLIPTIRYKKAALSLVAYPEPVIHLTFDVMEF